MNDFFKPTVIQSWQANDGTVHLSEEAARNQNIYLAKATHWAKLIDALTYDGRSGRYFCEDLEAHILDPDDLQEFLEHNRDTVLAALTVGMPKPAISFTEGEFADLLADLSKAAEDIHQSDYGLPRHSKIFMEEARGILTAWLQKLP